ncbi:MAG TPA: chorismate-binding protein [Myxococcales bacterium]|jgi:anthranilate/para-aminobenzoate synthase component I
MRLTALDRGAPFALLGPGFGLGRPVLVEDLREVTRAPLLAYASFEDRRPTLLGGKAQPIDLELDAAPQPLDPALDDRGYREAVEAIREAIAAGDVYQVCHTLRARLRPASGSELFATLCARGLPRFAAWVRLPDGTEFVSASPELFFETGQGRVRAEPMKGTARIDEAGKLEASEKDRAELAMITDLLRNDLTPVCRPRSVEVPCARRFIELPYALQAVSDVSGVLADGKGPLDVLAALHPGGSVTGAPKKAALEFVGKLETTPRGAYCGALGLIDGDRSVFGLLIRTASKTADGWIYGVGSGVVYDSNAEAELEEIRVKLGALR